MDNENYINHLLDQTKDLIWMVDPDFNLVYANNAYLDFMREAIGREKKLNETALIEAFGKEDNEKWKAYYSRALKGESFEVEENFYNDDSKKMEYNQITFEPLSNEDNNIYAVSCHSKDITHSVVQNTRANQLINASLDVFCTFNNKGEFVYVSAAAEKLWGYKPDELIGKPYLDFILEEDVAKTKEMIEAIKNGLKTKTFQNRYITKEGKVVSLSWTATSLPEQGIIYAVAKDITEEKSLRELNQQVGRLVQIGSWSIDLEKNTVFWSEEIHRLYETDSKSYVPTLEEGINFTREDYRQKVRSEVEKAIKTGEGWDFEVVVVTAKKKEVWVRSVGNAEFVKGKCVRLYGGLQDIHKEKVAAIELDKSLKELQDYKYSLDQSAIIAFTDHKGVITSINDNFCEISGYSQEELIGQTHQIINSKYHSKAFFKDLWKTIASGNVFRSEIKNKAKDGSYYWVDTTIVPFLNEKNKPKQFLAIRFDITERKKAETEKAKFQETLENSLNEIYMFNSKTLNFSYVNKGAMINLGYTKKELEGLTPLDLKPDYTASSFKQLISPLISSEKDKVVFSTRHKRKDGSHYPVEVHLKLVDEGENRNFIAIVLDITERKKAEEKLKATAERLRLATTTANIGIWDWDVVNDHLIWDETMHQIFGVAENEFTGAYQAWAARVHPDDINNANAEVQNALKGHSKFDTEFRVVWPDKSVRYVTGDAIVIRDDVSGEPIRMIGTNVDITERKRAEEEIRFKANLLRAVGQAVIATDLNGIVNYWNNAAELIYGWTSEEAIGKDILKLTPHKASKEEANQIMKILSKGGSWSGEFQAQNKDGSMVPIKITNSPIYDQNNNLSGMIGISSDISEEIKNKKLIKQYTTELERSNEELEQFAFITSHDLQEPLRMISSFMDQLERKYSDQLDEKAKQYIHFAADGAKRMKQIILDLLLYSRVNRPSEGVERVDLNEIVNEFLQLRRKLITDKEAIVTFDKLPILNTFKAPVTQIFNSLIDNALKYSRAKISPKINITVKEKEKFWEFTVEDNGIGINQQYYDKIFIIFQRLHNRKEYDGTGIGLPITKRAVEFLGGEIWVESVVGKGSTFYFTILKSIEKTQI